MEVGESWHQCHVPQVDDLRIGRHGATDSRDAVALDYDHRVGNYAPGCDIKHPVGTHHSRLCINPDGNSAESNE
jgi:hypothetical protein